MILSMPAEFAASWQRLIETKIRNLKGRESFHVTDSMTSERCLLTAAIKAEPLIDHQTIFGNADTSPARGFLEIHRLS